MRLVRSLKYLVAFSGVNLLVLAIRMLSGKLFFKERSKLTVYNAFLYALISPLSGKPSNTKTKKQN